MMFSFRVAEKFISKRLIKKKIYCLINEKIKEAGRVKTVCFDKTGTLTENIIKLYGYVIINEDK